MQKTCKLFLWILLATLSVPVLAQSSPPTISTSATPPNAAAAIPSPSKSSLTGREIVRRSLPSVVRLALETERVDAIKYGSGFFVTPDIVATNFHVVENTLDGYMKVVGQEPIYQILGLVGIDRDHDLALVKVKGVLPLI